MSAISSISSLFSQYESRISGSGSNSTSNTASTLLSTLENNSSSSVSSLLGSSSTSSSVDDESESLFTSKTNSLGEFYSYAKKLSSAADSLYSESENPSTLSYDDISAFVTSYNNAVNYASQNSEYVNSNELSSVQANITNSKSNLSSIGITVNSDGTLSINKDTLTSSLSNDASTVASTLKNVASATKTSSAKLVSNSLTNYTSSLKESLELSTKTCEAEGTSILLGQVVDTTL